MAGRRSSGNSKLWPFLFSLSACFNLLLFWWQGSVSSGSVSKCNDCSGVQKIADNYKIMLAACRAEVDTLKKLDSVKRQWVTPSEERIASQQQGAGDVTLDLENSRQCAKAKSELEACQAERLSSNTNRDKEQHSCSVELAHIRDEAENSNKELEQCRTVLADKASTTANGESNCEQRVEANRGILQRKQTSLEDSLHTSEQQFLSLQKSSKSSCVNERLELDPRWQGTEQIIRARTMAPLPASAPRVSETKFDITVNAFKRDMELEYSLNVYLKCMRERKAPISKIHVVWNDASRDVPKNLRKLASPEELEWFKPPGSKDKISNRFWPLEFSSEAVFHVDDDCPHMCELLSDMFQLWRTDPDGMVGSSPRLMDLQSGGLDSFAQPLISGMYNIVFLTKGAFIHKRFLDEYWKDEWKPMRKVADKFNCAEDVLFSIMHMTLVGTDHAYCIAGNVNHGRRMMLEGHSFYLEVKKVESYSGLNVRTWGVRGQAIGEIINLVRKRFPEKVEEGIYRKFQRKFWRSTVNPDLSCRMAPVPCFNRAWTSCYQDCEVPVRGNSVCFTGDSACFAGMGLSITRDIGENMQLVCTENGCTS